AREHARAQRPVRPDELDQRPFRHIGNVGTREVAAEIDDSRDGLVAPHRELGYSETRARRREDDRRLVEVVDHGFELPRLALDGRPRLELAGGEAATDPVEAHDTMGAG